MRLVYLCDVNLADYEDSVRSQASLRDRSSLLGVTPPPSGRSSPYRELPLHNGQRYADDLEGQNDEALEGLNSKVKLLKDVSEFVLL